MAKRRSTRDDDPSRRPNIGDISARTGLSSATISRAINDKPRVSPATRARVLGVLEEMGYVPSGLAVGLRTGHTGFVGLMIGEPRDPTALAAMQGALDATASTRYGVVVYMTRHPGEHARIYADVLARGWVDGALALWPLPADEPVIRRLHGAGFPLVLVEPEFPIHDVPSVYADAYGDGYRSTRHLLDLGHRRIALCAENPGVWPLDRGYPDGYRAALREAGVPLDPPLTVVADPADGISYDVGYAVATRWLRTSDPPTALCVSSDRAAMGAIAAARDLGLHVPDDLSVIGYDDTQMASWMKPTLTTPRARRHRLAQVACETLLGLIGGGPPPTAPLLVQTDLAIRQSTGRPRGRAE